MTKALHNEDSYLQHCQAEVVALTDEGIVLDQTVFYALGGGQPGDTGTLEGPNGPVAIVDTRKGEGGAVVHIPEGEHGLNAGDTVTATLDWDRRYRHMRMHTALHLLGVALPYGVTGGNISEKKSRLDFDMEDTVDKEALQQRLDELIAADTPIGIRWITDEELDAQPDLVRTLSVQPPRGVGRIRLLEIKGVDLQPCGGTHLRRTGEVGRARIGKVEKKGRRNRRVNLVLGD